jgi:arginase family enzyme
VEEGLLDPSRSLLAGMRGPLYEPADLEVPRELGFEVIPGPELIELTPAQYGARVRERLGAAGPVYLSFDIDVLDPASAPGTGTPEVAGLHPREALAFLRALAGISFTGFDVVEVAPSYDSPGHTTALNAAAVAYDLLALLAVARRGSRG